MSLSAAGIKSRILDNATDDPALDNVVQQRSPASPSSGRLLNIAAAVQSTNLP
jgi:hypothetical protein